MPTSSAVICAGSAALLVLHGCGGGDSDNNSTSDGVTTVVTTTTTTTTAFWCPGDDMDALNMPDTPMGLNGAQWQTMCLDKEEAHFFGLGDWGGETAGTTWDNTGGKRARVEPTDGIAARYVARQMAWRAGEVKPDFVLNAGDNFYAGGILHHCESPDAKTAKDPTGKFNEVRNTPFNATANVPWLSVLGNHDYGGIGHVQGWDVQIFHTWLTEATDGWRMPAQYWHQQVKYHGFAVDIFMLDSNFIDAGTDEHHDICGKIGGRPYDCYNQGLDNHDRCIGFFHKLWHDGLDWLDKKLGESTAEWKIINTHFPGRAIAQQPEIQELHKKHGIDLIYTGHQHNQEFGWEHGIPFVVSGGGGGVTSECAPSHSGRDNCYGFVDFTINATHLTSDFFSWGGPQGEMKDVMQSFTLLQGNHSTGAETSLTV